MNQYRHILEPYNGLSSRYRCPGCDKPRTFTRYIDTETGEQLPEHVGRCNREINCEYHYTPKQYFEENGQQLDDSSRPFKPRRAAKEYKAKPPSFIHSEAFKMSLAGYDQNHFISYLNVLFDEETTSQLISRYFIGTSKHWPGSTVFWQVDSSGKVRTGKIMLYSPSTGKRIKEPYNHITWAHSVLKQPDFNLIQCFFGEHLLKDTSKPVAIVESEKTAVIASQHLPQFIWLAVGSLTNLSRKRCQVLQGRKVVLFPDLNGFEKWQEKAKELSGIASFTVSDLLEQKATETEREQGLDLADYLVRPANKGFAVPEAIESNNDRGMASPTLTHTKDSGNGGKELQQIKEDVLPPAKRKEPKEKQRIATDSEANSNDELAPIVFEVEELESFFSSFLPPDSPVKLDSAMTVTDIPLFVKSHMATIKANQGRRSFKPYFDRLQFLRESLNNSSKN